MKYYLGIDGGGTKTTVAVGDENGLIFKQTGKSINFYSVGMDVARKNLKAIIDEVESVIDTDEFESVFIGCSALDSEADDELISSICNGIINAKKIKIHSDVYIALESVCEGDCPCVAVCGTGSMAIGRDADKTTYITGGWGHVLGDEGSAYTIALSGLKLCCRQFDNGETTPLIDGAERYFNKADFRKIIDIIYSPDTTKDVIAGFASIVSNLAKSGDEKALEIINTQAVEFAKTVSALLKKINSCDALGLCGGVFENNKIFRKAFCEKIKEEYPLLKISLVDTPADESALKLARKL